MIHGIGTDLVRVARMQDVLQRFGDRFADRILTAEEQQDYRRTRRKAHFLARRFAAKEALLKALGTGLRDGMRWRDIAVVHDRLGRPCLDCDGRVGQALRDRDIGRSHLSLSDEDEYAIACVVLETDRIHDFSAS